MTTPGAGSGNGKFKLSEDEKRIGNQVDKLILESKQKQLQQHLLSELAKLGIKPPYPETVRTKKNFNFEVQRAALIRENDPAMSAKAMKGFHEKTLRNIQTATEIAEKAIKNAEKAKKATQKINSNMTRKQPPSFLRSAMNNVTRKQQRNDKLRKAFGLPKNSTQKNIINKIANYLGMAKGRPYQNYINELRKRRA